MITARWGEARFEAIDHAGQFLFAEKGTEVDVAELQDAQTVQIGRQTGQRDVDSLTRKWNRSMNVPYPRADHGSGHQGVTRRVQKTWRRPGSTFRSPARRWFSRAGWRSRGTEDAAAPAPRYIEKAGGASISESSCEKVKCVAQIMGRR